MDKKNRSKANKRYYEPPAPKKQREKRKPNFNGYNNLNLNSPVNFILSTSAKPANNDDDNDDRLPTPPPAPNLVFNEVHNSPQLRGIGGKLLLQMGYEPGKGLGKNLQGIQVPIKAKPRFGRGAIGAYGPENAHLLPIETINTASNSRRLNDDKFVAGDIYDDVSSDDETNNVQEIYDISDDETNNVQDADSIINNFRSIALSDQANKITSTTPIAENTEKDLDINIKSSWKLSVISVEYPKIQLSEDHFEQIENKIFDILFNTENQNFIEPIQFHKSQLIDGTMQFLSANESTKNWLYQIIDNNTLLKNIKLKVVESDSLLKNKQVKIWLCGPKSSADIIIKTLQKQNPNLKTDKWRIFDLNYFRNFNSTELIVGIDCISLAELKKEPCAEIYQNNLIFLMRQISSMETLNENFDSIEYENNLESDMKGASSSWADFMTEMRSRLLKTFGYDPKSDFKLLSKPKNFIISVNGSSTNGSSKKNIKKTKSKIPVPEVSDSLKLAIIDRGDVEGKIRNVIHQEILDKTLEEAVIQRSENIKYSGRFKDDIFNIICENEHTKNCLHEIVKNIGKLWYDADLCLVGLVDLIKFRHSLKEKNNIIKPSKMTRKIKRLSAKYDKSWKDSEQKSIRRLEKKSSQKNFEINNNCSQKEMDISVPDTLKIAIIDKSDFLGRISDSDNQNLLEDTLFNALIKMCENRNIEKPRYHWSGFIDGIFKVICYDEQSKIYMKEMVKKAGTLWMGADLAVVGLEELLNFQQKTTVKVLKSDVKKLSKEYDDWKSFEQYDLEESKKIISKPCDNNPKEQRKLKKPKSKNYPSGYLILIRKKSNEKFTHNEFTTLRDSINLLIYRLIKTKEFSPQIENINFTGENLCIICANLSTQEWFAKSIIPELTSHPPWQDGKLKFDFINNGNGENNDAIKLIAAKVYLPGLKLQFNDYLQMLEAQNNLIDTKLWEFVDKKESSEGVHLYLKIDKQSALNLNTLKKRPYYGSGRVIFKF